MKTKLCAGLLCALVALVPSYAAAQMTAAEVLEQARAKAGDIEELRKILNGPDASLRFAVFDSMIKSGDETLKQIAIETAFGSADDTLRALAFKHVIFGMESVRLTLEVDPQSDKTAQESSMKLISEYGNGYNVVLGDHNFETGTFKRDYGSAKGSFHGHVSGLEFQFRNQSNSSGSLRLDPENVLRGKVSIGASRFLASFSPR